MNRNDDIPGDELELFREHMRDVQPLQQDRVEARRPTPPPIPNQTLENQRLALAESLGEAYDAGVLETGEEVFFSRPEVRRQTLRKLRRGRFRISAELDLHGMIVATARAALADFIRQCQTENRRCVQIIHGKGLGSRDRPVLKHMTHTWLRRTDAVLAFCSAVPVHGGSGAVYVLLRPA